MDSYTNCGAPSFQRGGHLFQALVLSLLHLGGGKTDGHSHAQHWPAPGGTHGAEERTLPLGGQGRVGQMHSKQGRMWELSPEQQHVTLGPHSQVWQSILGEVLTSTQ